MLPGDAQDGLLVLHGHGGGRWRGVRRDCLLGRPRRHDLGRQLRRHRLGMAVMLLLLFVAIRFTAVVLPARLSVPRPRASWRTVVPGA